MIDATNALYSARASAAKLLDGWTAATELRALGPLTSETAADWSRVVAHAFDLLTDTAGEVPFQAGRDLRNALTRCFVEALKEAEKARR